MLKDMWKLIGVDIRKYITACGRLTGQKRSMLSHIDSGFETYQW